MSYEPDTLEGIKEFCEREGQPCESLHALIGFEVALIELDNAMNSILDRVEVLEQRYWQTMSILGVTNAPPIFGNSGPTEPETDYAVDPTAPATKDGKYGIIMSSEKEFHPREPVFLLRATDQNAIPAIVYYREFCEGDGCSDEHIEAIRQHMRRIGQWQIAHPHLVKQPD